LIYLDFSCIMQDNPESDEILSLMDPAIKSQDDFVNPLVSDVIARFIRAIQNEAI
jgi:hypothetical protein